MKITKSYLKSLIRKELLEQAEGGPAKKADLGGGFKAELSDDPEMLYIYKGENTVAEIPAAGVVKLKNLLK